MNISSLPKMTREIKASDEQIENLFASVEEAIVAFGFADLRGEHAQHWHALRISTDGSTYTSTEASACYSVDEYYSRAPHTLTLHTVSGNYWSPSAEENPGWGVNEDGTIDLTDWYGDALDADEIAVGWRETLQDWIDAGNFCPASDDNSSP